MTLAENPLAEQQLFKLNDVEITLIAHEGGYIPVKPICEALDIDYSSQIKRIDRDPILSPTMVAMTTVARDGKKRSMLSLPFGYVFGWLFSIDASRVAEEVKPGLIKYQIECYQALLRHFTEKEEYYRWKLEADEKALNTWENSKRKSKEDGEAYKKQKSISLEEWRAMRQQLSLPFAQECSTDPSA